MPLQAAVSAKGSLTYVRQPPASQHWLTSPRTTAPQRARKTSRPARHDRLDLDAGMIVVGERTPGSRVVVARGGRDPPDRIDEREDRVHGGVEGVSGALRARVDVGGADRAQVLRGGALWHADVK